MSKPDIRGDKFGAYYLVDEILRDEETGKRKVRLYGIEFYQPVIVSEKHKIAFITLYKKELNDHQGKQCEFVDFALGAVDTLGDSPPFQHLLADYISEEVISTLHPVTQLLVRQDIEEGLTCEGIIERRAAILPKEFLGFTHDQIPEQYKTITVHTDEEIGEYITQDLRRCSREE